MYVLLKERSCHCNYTPRHFCCLLCSPYGMMFELLWKKKVLTRTFFWSEPDSYVMTCQTERSLTRPVPLQASQVTNFDLSLIFLARRLVPGAHCLPPPPQAAQVTALLWLRTFPAPPHPGHVFIGSYGDRLVSLTNTRPPPWQTVQVTALLMCTLLYRDL